LGLPLETLPMIFFLAVYFFLALTWALPPFLLFIPIAQFFSHDQLLIPGVLGHHELAQFLRTHIFPEEYPWALKFPATC
jgi:hypothetical protein